MGQIMDTPSFPSHFPPRPRNSVLDSRRLSIRAWRGCGLGGRREVADVVGRCGGLEGWVWTLPGRVVEGGGGFGMGLGWG